MWWRVLVWFLLNLLFTFSGLLLLVVQRLSRQKLVGDSQLAAFLLDTSQVLHKKDRAFCDFSTLTKDDKGISVIYTSHGTGMKGVTGRWSLSMNEAIYCVFRPHETCELFLIIFWSVLRVSSLVKANLFQVEISLSRNFYALQT
jgi:hypothetical protein